MDWNQLAGQYRREGLRYASDMTDAEWARTLTGSVVYTFSYSSNGTVLPRSCPGDVFANQLRLLLNKTF